MKKHLLSKILVFFFFFSFGTTSLYSQVFCCCETSGCVENPLSADNDCNYWCDFLITGDSNLGDAAGYPTNTCAGSVCAAMPVETTFFKGTIIRDDLVELSWQTALEINNEGFEIQRANADFRWEFLAFEKGNGNTTETINYSFIDRSPYPGTNYYRFKQMDYDGNYDFSKVVIVKVKNAKGGVTIFPTLAKEKLLVKFSEQPTTPPSYQIFDLMGRKVLETKSEHGVLDISGLETGQYVISFLIKGELHTERFFKIN